MQGISAPASFADVPLAQLKQWLAITSTADDALLVELLGAAHTLCSHFTGIAALSSDWDTLDAGLRHGIIRHAAHQYRERDTGPQDTPPAAIAALWRPWRRLRL